MPENDVPNGSGSADLPSHPLVAKLLPNLDNPQKNAFFIGYVGPSKDGEKIRIYTSLSFDTYVELLKSSVVASASSVKDDDNSPTVVFVAADAQVDQVSTTTQSGPAAFLSGAIASSRLSSAGGMMQGGAGVGCQAYTTTVACTFGGAQAKAGSSVDCCGTFFTAGCTFPSGAAAAGRGPGVGCDYITGTFVCTFGGAQAKAGS